MKSFLENYGLRHQHPANIVMHVIGLPVTFILPIVLLVMGMSWEALAAFLIGYGFQFLGHAIEGNDAGEVILVKKLLGKPYTDVVGPNKGSTGTEDSADKGDSA